MTIRVLVIEDHELFRAGVALGIDRDSDFELAGTAGSGIEGVSAYATLRPDVVLCDVMLGEISGFETLRRIRSFDAAMRACVISALATEADMLAALEVGALGYLQKTEVTSEELLPKLCLVAEGREAFDSETATSLVAALRRNETGRHLTPRELEAVRLMADGLSNEAIADRLGISANTVKGMTRVIYRRLRVPDRAAAVAWAFRSDLLS